MRRVINWCMLVFVLYIVFELSSLFGLFLIKKIYHKSYNPTRTQSLSEKHKAALHTLLKNQSTYGKYSPDLGWTIKKNGTSPLFQANAQGLRGDRDYSLKPPPNIVRIATFGDSFTHGDEVKNKQTWQEKLNSIDQNLEILNFGVNGYGLDQSFLRYQKDGVKFNSHIVLIGFLSEKYIAKYQYLPSFLYAEYGRCARETLFYTS